MRYEDFEGQCPICHTKMKQDVERDEWVCPKCTMTFPHLPQTTQFTCECGAKWNLISPESDTDRCPDCGMIVGGKQ